MLSGGTDPRKDPIQNRLIREVNALTRTGCAGLPDPHVDFLTNAGANTPVLVLPEPAVAGAA